MLHIGKRSLKTAASLTISLSIFLVLIGFNHLLGFNELPSAYVTSKEFWYVPTNWYTPFFAGIASVYAMSANITASIKQANIRNLGSVVGGYWGFIVVMVFTLLFPDAVKGEISYYIPLFIITVIGILPLMKIIQLLKIPQAGFISGLTYLAVTISIRNGGMGPLLFTTNRVLSTIIGVSISVYINSIPHFRKKGKEILFLLSADGALCEEDGHIEPMSLNYLSDFLHYKIKFTYMTSDPVTHLKKSLKDTELNMPVIVMDGAAVYTPGSGYGQICTMDKSTENKIRSIAEKHDLSLFSYVFHENHLFGYYEKTGTSGERKYFENHNQELTPMVKASVPEDLEVSKLTAVVKDEETEGFMEELKSVKEINLYTFPHHEMKGYTCVDITSTEASAVKALERMHLSYEKLAVAAGTEQDAEMIRKADYSLCRSSAPEKVKKMVNYTLPEGSSAELLRTVRNIFFTGNFPS